MYAIQTFLPFTVTRDTIKSVLLPFIYYRRWSPTYMSSIDLLAAFNTNKGFGCLYLPMIFRATYANFESLQTWSRHS